MYLFISLFWDQFMLENILHLIYVFFLDLFNQAIMMSGSDLSEWAVISQADSVEYSKRLALEVGCPSGDSQRLVDCLRYSRSFSEIVNASARVVMLVSCSFFAALCTKKTSVEFQNLSKIFIKLLGIKYTTSSTLTNLVKCL